MHIEVCPGIGRATIPTKYGLLAYLRGFPGLAPVSGWDYLWFEAAQGRGLQGYTGGRHAIRSDRISLIKIEEEARPSRYRQ